MFANLLASRLLHTRLRARAVAALVFAAALTATPAATAQAPSGAAQTTSLRDQARAAYSRGQQEFEAGRYVEAKTAFEAAFTAIPNPVVLLSIAETQERMEQYADALATLERYLRLRPDAPDSQTVDERIRMLKLKPATVRVATEPSGATVIVDGSDTNMRTPAAIELLAGEHQLLFNLPGYHQGHATVSLAPGDGQDISLQLQSEAPPPSPDDVFGGQAPPPLEPAGVVESDLGAEAQAGAASSCCTGVWIASGVGAAALVTGSVLGLLALDASNDFEDIPTDATADRGERLALFADVAFGVGAMSLITAVVLYATDSQGEESESERGLSLGLGPGPGSAGLSARLRF
ncbi:MAG: PEGA domain-containing protein [Proteobacteria bacterium]|nr:PEGA domain-containing protein [Pseudomonadota bacterium]